MTAVILSLVLSASQPSTRPRSVEADLRAIIASLQKQVATLKAENESLKSRLQRIPAPPATTTATANNRRFISVGMSFKEAAEIVGEEPHLQADRGEAKMYEFRTMRHVLEGPPPMDADGFPHSKYVFCVWVQEGKIKTIFVSRCLPD